MYVSAWIWIFDSYVHIIYKLFATEEFGKKTQTVQI